MELYEKFEKLLLFSLNTSQTNFVVFIAPLGASEVTHLELEVESRFDQLACKLQVVVQNISGLRIDEFTHRVTSYVMVNNLAMQYNLFGRNGKRAFTQSCLFDIF